MYFRPPPGTLYLEDRHPPLDEGWQWVRTVAEAIAVIDAGGLAHASLDYDLGMFDTRKGSDVAQHMADTGRWPTETLLVHSGSTEGRRAIGAIVEASGEFSPAEDHALGLLYRRAKSGALA